MGQPRPDEGENLSDPEWAARFAAEYRKRRHTPPAQLELGLEDERQRGDPESLAAQAVRAKQQAIEEGRVTPRPTGTREGETCIETPGTLQRYREAGRERARARLARMSEQSLEGADSRGPK